MLKLEIERLKTFYIVKWPLPFIKPESLARAGFIYLLDRDRVQCVFCKGILYDWKEQDVPILEHKYNFPRCNFLEGYDVGNIAICNDPIRDN